MKTLKESILSSNNVSLITLFQNLVKQDSNDNCQELNDCWKMLHLDIPDHKWDNSPRFDFYSYEDPDQSPVIWVFYNTKIPSIVFSKVCEESYKEKVVKTLKLEKGKKDNLHIIK